MEGTEGAPALLDSNEACHLDLKLQGSSRLWGSDMVQEVDELEFK